MLKKYLLNNLSSIFFSIFFILFGITSIIFLVKIASLTSVIELNFKELLLLYSFSIPNLLFFTLPISFIIGLTLALSKLSSDYELLVISSFGQNPLAILKFFIPLSLILSVMLLFISTALIPKVKYLNNIFIDNKKKEAQFNIKASSFGQEFGDWLIFIEKDDDKTFETIRLFKKDIDSNTFIMAKTAKIFNKNNSLSLVLNDGKNFIIRKNKIEQIDFTKMTLLDAYDDSKRKNFTTLYRHWKDIKTDKLKAELFSFNILISLLPVLSMLLILTFGYFNPRYDRNLSFIYSFSSIVIYVLIVQKAAAYYPFISIIIIPVIWICLSILLYMFTVYKKY